MTGVTQKLKNLLKTKSNINKLSKY